MHGIQGKCCRYLGNIGHHIGDYNVARELLVDMSISGNKPTTVNALCSKNDPFEDGE